MKCAKWLHTVTSTTKLTQPNPLISFGSLVWLVLLLKCASAKYPRYVGSDRGDEYSKDNLIQGLHDWQATESHGSIEQVAHTYGYLDGDYGIQNTEGLSMGESTCGGVWGAQSVPIFDGGDALLEMAELSRIAMERCATARCAVQLMGDLAVEHGFYGAVWKVSLFSLSLLLCLVPCALCLVPCALCLLPCALCLVPCALMKTRNIHEPRATSHEPLLN